MDSPKLNVNVTANERLWVSKITGRVERLVNANEQLRGVPVGFIKN